MTDAFVVLSTPNMATDRWPAADDLDLDYRIDRLKQIQPHPITVFGPFTREEADKFARDKGMEANGFYYMTKALLEP